MAVTRAEPEARPAAAPARPRWASSHHAEIFVASFAALLVEIAYTRVVSYKLFYYYVYLVIGLALLGLGAGGVLVAVSSRLRSWATDTVLFWSFLLGSATTIAVYVLVAVVRIDSIAVWRYGTGASMSSFLGLVAMCIGISASFVAPGVVAATLFGRRPEGIGSLYAADLVGAGLACALAVAAISALGAPATVMVAAAAMGVGAMLVGRRLGSWRAWLGAAATSIALLATVAPGLLPSQ
ncbi:MAG TPA: hypothetical protein VMU09_12635, partial [Acidimicrobiales bacterium]|nr:hypothetical protein [Acidimicrobiales bacterium]